MIVNPVAAGRNLSSPKPRNCPIATLTQWVETVDALKGAMRSPMHGCRYLGNSMPFMVDADEKAWPVVRPVRPA